MPFDYRKGRLFRFQRRLENEEAGATHAIAHFWLCPKCTKIYTLEYRERSGVAVLRSRHSPPKAVKQKARAEAYQTAAVGSK